MVNSESISIRVEEIHWLIASDEVPKAVKRVLDFARDFSGEHLKEAIVISSNYTRLSKELRQGIIDYTYGDQKRNQLLYRMLELIDEIHTNGALNAI